MGGQEQPGVDVEGSLVRLETLIRFIPSVRNPGDKIDGLEEFEKIEKDLIDGGHFSSEEEILKFLESQGQEAARPWLKIVNSAQTLADARAVRK